MKTMIVTDKIYGKCVEIEIEDKRMMISLDYGPRIVHLNIGDGGDNILFFDKNKEFKVGDWFIYGGHRLWISPESKISFSPDNEKCSYEVNDKKVTVCSIDDIFGVKKTIEISENDGKFCVNHIVKNISDVIVVGGAWAITCIAPIGKIFFPWTKKSSWRAKKIIYWENWGSHTTNFQSTQFQPNRELFIIEQKGEKCKVGTGGEGEYVGVVTDNYTFIKSFKHNELEVYPDDNCAIEVFTCKEYGEMETLSPLYKIYPEREISHLEEWTIEKGSIDLNDIEMIEKLIK